MSESYYTWEYSYSGIFLLTDFLREKQRFIEIWIYSWEHIGVYGTLVQKDFFDAGILDHEERSDLGLELNSNYMFQRIQSDLR